MTTPLEQLAGFCKKHDLPWSTEILAGFQGYVDLLLSFNASMNLIGPMDEMRVIDELFMDSLVPAMATSFEGARVLDVGTGAGLPGIVLAIAYKDAHVTLVEPRKKRANFMRIAAQRLGLQGRVQVEQSRIEDVPEGTFDKVISKAFAPPVEWLGIAQPWMAPQGQILCMTRQSQRLPLEQRASELGLALVASATRKPYSEDEHTREVYVFDSIGLAAKAEGVA